MANRSPIRVGQTGILRAVFTDDAGLPIEATNIEVNLYAPNLDPDIDTPTVSGLTPTYIGNGVYQLEVTGVAPEGRWIDQWSGDILGVETTVNLAYNVMSGGVIVAYPTFGLNCNNVIEITLSEDITSIEGISLTEDYILTFTTEYSPLYSSVRKVRLEVGGMLLDVPDDTVNLAIFEASLEANELTWRKCLTNKGFYEHARREYVTCKAAGVLLNNIAGAGGLLKSKTLDNFQVVYDTSSLRNAIDKSLDCADKWMGQLAAGGGLNASRNPRMVVKGELDPDRPEMRRSMDEHSRDNIPAANTAYRHPGHRRSVKGYKPPRGGGRGGLW